MRQDVVVQLEKFVAGRLAHWPPQWEGFHWPGYTYEHTLRVRNLALVLGDREGAEREVVELAAFLHDIAKPEGKNHARLGAEEAARVLRSLGCEPELVARAHYAIATHSGDNTLTHPVENRVLGDADLIDANFGLVATWRFITIRAGRQSTIEDTIAGMAEWLPRKDELVSLLRTEAGLGVARERSAAMHYFCAEVAEAFAGAGKGTPGLAQMVQYLAGNYERAALVEQIPVIRQVAGAEPRVVAACDRLEAEIAGEV